MKLKKTLKLLAWVLASGLLFYAGNALAQATLGTVADNVTATMSNLAKLITAVAYVAGMGFAMAAILKFKAHRDNPTQIPIGTPIALLFIAIVLLFLPTLFGIGGQTLFGGTKSQAGVTGITTFS